MKYHAIGKNIVIKVMKKPEDESDKKGIILVNTAKPWDHVDYAEVLAKGDQVRGDFEVGDKILMRGHCGVPIAPAEDDKTIRVIDESEVLVKIGG